MNKIIIPLLFLLVSSFTGCSVMQGMLYHADNVATSIEIEGVTYRSGFYGDLYPVFGQVGDIGSDTLQKEIVYAVGEKQFRRVDYDGHDWVHSYIGPYTGGTVYCADAQWEQMCDYYADPNNYNYYCGVGYYISETAIHIPEIDLQKYNALIDFGKANNYNPFDKASKKKIEQTAHRIPKSEFNEGVCFYKISNDGYFTSLLTPMYFVHDSKLLMVFYHDGGSRNGGIQEVVALEVPDELGQYFIDLMDKYR